jgi:hypothetical protein
MPAPSRDDLVRLAELIRRRNAIDAEIGAVIGRPALIGHAGEYIAAGIFGIDLHESAVHAGSDGHFRDGPLAGRSVNVKWYGKQAYILDINPSAACDYSLVMTGPLDTVLHSRGGVRPWCIESVYLFQMAPLLERLAETGVKVGIATSVRKAEWDSAEVFPRTNNPALPLTQEQRDLLTLFAPE